MSGNRFDRSFLRLRGFAFFDVSSGAKLGGGTGIGER